MIDIGFGYEARAPFASDPAASRGRLVGEPASPTRTAFQRDRDRIIHSAAFRRLQYKTQVFVYHEGDHYRTRLTHTLEVAQISRALARAFRLDQDLAEAIALGHDLGHPPFGHVGERALAAATAATGGFDHNAQALRVVTRLERRYAAFDGLNLTWETLEGLAKHNGPLLDSSGQATAEGGALPWAMREVAAEQDLRLASHPSLEAQAAAIADDIAYDAHDLDDGLRAGLITLADVEEVPFAASLLARSGPEGDGDPSRAIHELTRRLITGMVEDVLAEAGARLAGVRPACAEAVREAAGGLIAFSPAMAENDAALKRFLGARVYRHPDVTAVMRDAGAVVTGLFAAYRADPRRMPPEWQAGLDLADAERLDRRICDYVAGMTDRFCLQEHARHVGRRANALFAV